MDILPYDPAFGKKDIFVSISRTRAFIAGQFRRLLQIQSVRILLTVLLTPVGMYYYLYVYGYRPFFEQLNHFASIGFVPDESGHSFIVFLADRIAGGLYYVVPLTLGLAITMYVLHYYQVRAEKENFTEELLAQELGYQPVEEMMNV